MPIDWRVQLYQSVETTQSYVKDAIASGEPEGVVVQALEQKSGKGRHGNVWNSPIGNLYMSVLLRPDCEARDAGQLAFVVAVALSKALDDYIDEDKHKKTLKWPNDILVDGLKICGILLESEIKQNKTDAVIVGTGLNIFKAPELAVGLNDVSEIPVYVNTVRDNILDKLSYYYKFWQKKGFAPIREAWLKQAHGLDQPMSARLPDKSEKGVFRGITDDGSLILETEAGEKIIHAAEVHFGPEAEETA